MKVYIASRDQAAARRLRQLVETCGHEVTSRWIDEPGYIGMPAQQCERVNAARDNLDDVRKADVVLLRSEPDGSFVPGGKHVETGAALALGKPVILLGRPENVFQWHPLVAIAGDEAALVRHLEDLKASWRVGVAKVE